MAWEKNIRASVYWWVVVTVGVLAAAASISLTHSSSSIVSFDEGFHGQAALAVRHGALAWLGFDLPYPTLWVARELINGVSLYPPSWALVAGLMGLIFGPSVFVFRFATMLFYIGVLLFTFWFVGKVTKNRATALASTAVLATVPMVVIYSDLMMLEVPMLAGVTAMVGSLYLWCTGGVRRTWWVGLIITLVCVVGSLTKLPATPVAWGTFVGFAVVSSIAYAKSGYYKHFLKPELLIFLLASTVPMAVYVWAIEHVFNIDMIGFFLGQSEGIQEGSSNPIIHALEVAWDRKDFYLRDFKHIPGIAAIWFGSVAVYAAWRRTPYSLLLLIWAIVCWVLFSGVQPQVPQYIMPIYVPFALASAAVLVEVCERVVYQRWSTVLATGMVSALVFSQALALPRSEGYGWRNIQSDQEAAAALVASRAKEGDSVITWSDANTFLLRLAGFDKRLQVINGTTQLCEAAMADSFDWAVVTEGQPPPPSVSDREVLAGSGWELLTPNALTKVYYNRGASWPLRITGEQFHGVPMPEMAPGSDEKVLILSNEDPGPQMWGCRRSLPYGEIRATFTITPLKVSADIPDAKVVMKFDVDGPPKEQAIREVTAGELRRSSGLQQYSLTFTHEETNQQNEFRAFVYDPVILAVHSLDLESVQ